eukprot:scaffold18405_cov26-Tisochrysis_lutea.AAC.2
MIVEDMQEALWSLSDQRRSAAEGFIGELHTDGWLAQHALRIVLALLAMSDAETNRYVRTCAVLKLYASLRAGRPVDLPLPELAQAPVPEAVSLEIPAIDFTSRAGGGTSTPAKGGAANAKGPGKGAKDSAAGAVPTLTDAVSLLVRSYSEPIPAVQAPPSPTEGEEGPSREELLATEWSMSLAAAFEGERCKLVRRLTALARYGCGMISELKRQAERLQSELDNMLGEHMRKESESISALASVMRKAAEAGDMLVHSLTLENEVLVVDESLLLVPPTPPPPLPPVIQPAEVDKFTIVQLASLGARLKQIAAATDLLPSSVLAATLEQLSVGAFDVEEPPLPAAWWPLGAPEYAKIAAAFAAGEPPLVAWPEFVAALAPVSPPSKEALLATLEKAARSAGRVELLGEESPSDVAVEGEAPPPEDDVPGESAGAEAAGEQDQPAAARVPTRLLLDRDQYDETRLWFEDEFAPAEGTYPVGDALKATLWDLFADPSGTLDVARLLLYFCNEASKAFVVVGFLRPPAAGVDSSSLSKAELYAVLHRDMPVPAAGVAPATYTDPFSAPAIDRLWQELQLGEDELVAHAHMARHPFGRAMLNACKAYLPKEVYAMVGAMHARAQNALKM